MQEGFHPAFMGAPLPVPGKGSYAEGWSGSTVGRADIFVFRTKYTRTMVGNANRQMSAVRMGRRGTSFVCGVLVSSFIGCFEHPGQA